MFLFSTPPLFEKQFLVDLALLIVKLLVAVELLPALEAKLLAGLNLFLEISDLSLQVSDVLLVLIPRSLRSLPVLLLLDAHALLLRKLGSGHRGTTLFLFFYDLLLPLEEGVVGEILGTLAVNGGRFSLVLAHGC